MTGETIETKEVRHIVKRAAKKKKKKRRTYRHGAVQYNISRVAGRVSFVNNAACREPFQINFAVQFREADIVHSAAEWEKKWWKENNLKAYR